MCWDEVTRSIWVTVARNGGINSVRTKKRRWFGRGKEEGKSQEVEAQAVYYMRRRDGKCGATEKKTIQYKQPRERAFRLDEKITDIALSGRILTAPPQASRRPAVSPLARLEHVPDVEAREDDGGKGLGCGVEDVEQHLRLGGAERSWSRGKEGWRVCAHCEEPVDGFN